jgi:hypothetical protein
MTPSAFMSDKVDLLAPALVTMQAALNKAAKGAENPHLHSRYANLADVWDAMGPALQDNGFALLQSMETLETRKGFTITTTLMHTSGQYVWSSLSLDAPMNDPQKVGSAITYARRYCAATLVGVVTDDDDGHAATAGARNGQAQPQARPAPASKPAAPPRSSDARTFRAFMDELTAAAGMEPWDFINAVGRGCVEANKLEKSRLEDGDKLWDAMKAFDTAERPAFRNIAQSVTKDVSA